jgi:hypothetical protein
MRLEVRENSYRMACKVDHRKKDPLDSNPTNEKRSIGKKNLEI